jgi:hypothetical protein
MGERELPAILQSSWTESVFWDYCSAAPALLTEPVDPEAIIGFQGIGPCILLSQYGVKWVTNWLGLRIYGLFIQGNLPPTYKLTWSWQFKACLRQPSYPDQALIHLSAAAEWDESPAPKREVSWLMTICVHCVHWFTVKEHMMRMKCRSQGVTGPEWYIDNELQLVKVGFIQIQEHHSGQDGSF